MRTQELEHPQLKELVCHEMMGNYYNPFCPGCGYGIIAHTLNKVLLERGDLLSYPLVTGVGCTCYVPFILVGNSFYCLHGRALPFATGLKLANPSLKPIVFTGDGDCLSIGMAHFMHAARRNVDMVVLLLNNEVYGMTGGQMAPTTAPGVRTTTTPFGMKEASFDGVKLAIDAGASYVARWTIAQPLQIARSIRKALDHRGFSLLELISICPTYRGRLNELPTPVAMLRWLKANTIPLSETEGKSPQDLVGKHVVGEFLEDREKPELSQIYERLIAEATRRA
ncbi:MAG: 2-oxoacid:ferredoxin oxidoreductase subunit beta [Chloroflexi bacterium]|nr:2-oxoacid:ferredoxin oxidoreductase subunit beta [Chloroflexota bacterium]